MPSSPRAFVGERGERTECSCDRRADDVTVPRVSWDLDERTYRAVLAAIAVLLVFVHWDALVLGLPVFGSDSSLFYPLQRDFSRQLAAGVFPHWSDRYMGGQPASAEANFALFHPLRLALLRFAGVRGEGLWLYLHALLAALGMAAYCRSVGRSKLASAMAALSYPLCGFFVGHVVHSNAFASAAWVPTLLLCVEKILRGKDLRWVGALAGASALQYLSGHPQTALLAAYYVGLYALLRAAVFPEAAPARGAVRPLLLTAGGLALGLGLAAIQILPMIGILEQAARIPAPGYRFSAAGSLSGTGLLLPVFPAIYGTQGASDLSPFWLSDVGGHWGAWEFHCYPGALIALLAVQGGLRARWDRSCRVQLLLLLVVFLYAMGRWTPVHWVLWHLPGLDAGRVPSRALLFAAIGMIHLATAGLDDLSARGAEARRSWLRSSCAVLGVVLTVWAMLGIGLRVTDSLLANAVQHASRRPDVGLRALEHARVATGATAVAAFTNAALLAMAALAGLWWIVRPGRRTALALLVLLAVDLMWFDGSFGAHSAGRRDAHEPPPYLSQLDPSQRFFSLVDWNQARAQTWAEFREVLPTQLSAAWGVDTPDGNTGMLAKDYVKSLFQPLRDADVDGSERVRRARRHVDRLRILGVGAISTRSQWGELPWPLLYRSEAVSVWRVPAPLPRAFVSTRRDLAEDRARHALTDPDPDPEERALLTAIADSLQGRVDRLTGSIPQDVVFDVETPASGTFVRTTRNADGWRAFVDGEERPIQTVLGFFQGVELPPGPHRLRFTFETPGLRVGAALSGASAAVVLLLVAIGRARCSRSPVGDGPRRRMAS